VQVLADAKGHLLWASAALPGAVRDLTAARRHGIITALRTFGVAYYADKAYQGAGPNIAVPFRRRPRPLSSNQRTVNANRELLPLGVGLRERRDLDLLDGPGLQPRARRTSQRHPQDLETPHQNPLLPDRATAIINVIRNLQTIEDQH
jgi:hypothetical protein